MDPLRHSIPYLSVLTHFREQAICLYHISVSYCHVTNHPQMQWLKQHILLPMSTNDCVVLLIWVRCSWSELSSLIHLWSVTGLLETSLGWSLLGYISFSPSVSQISPISEPRHILMTVAHSHGSGFKRGNRIAQVLYQASGPIRQSKSQENDRF